MPLLRSIIAIVLFACVVCAGCSSRPTSEVLQPVAHAPMYTNKVRLLVATTRERGSETDPEAYTAGRAKHLNYAALTVSIPRNHTVGEIEWPNQYPADPAYHFITTDRQVYSHEQYLREVSGGNGEPGSVLVFVHGYNTLYEEAVYRFAQIVHDSGYQGTAILFAWPSRGSAPLYLADREASTYSRDYLEQALLDLAALPQVREINVLAHSMGNWLTVETLRQAGMKGHASFKGKLGEVVLASPDLDVNVFRTQLEAIGPLPRPMTVLVSGDDKALKLSTMLAGGVERAGMLTANDVRAVEGARQYNLRVVDLTNVEGGDGSHHSKFAQSDAVITALGHGLQHEGQHKAQSGLVSAVTNVGSSLLSVPTAIIGAAAGQ